MKRRVQGLAFVTVIVSLLSLSVATYAGVFERGVPVTLQVERAGSQLNTGGDVKVRGLIVGTIEQISSDGDGATVELSLEPELAGTIPAGVSARLLPKTLFGEKFVSLVPPQRNGTATAGQMIAAGDVIGQDRSATARELEVALDGLLPLLEAVPPQDLATTLGALSQALAGRGENLGETLVNLQELTGGLRPAIPDLQEDITQLADFAGNLDQAAPDLLDAIEDLTVTGGTIVEQRTELRALLTGLTTASDDTRGFLDRNGENLIALAASARPTLESLERYSPEFPCLFSQLAGVIPLADQAFGKGTGRPGIYITLEITNNNGKYVPDQDEPEYLDDRGPRCYPILPLGPQQPPEGPFEDGSEAPPAPVDTPMGSTDEFGGDTFGTTPASYTGMGVPNSPGERQIVAELVAAQDGGDPSAVPSWSSMMVGPLYRGAEVTFT